MHVWSGKCSAGLHGLDFEGQRCALCAFVPITQPADPPKINPALFASQPQIQFKLPDGPYEVIEEPPGLVHVHAKGRKHPILSMPRALADQLGWTEAEPPDPPTSGTRLSPRRPNDGENHG